MYRCPNCGTKIKKKYKVCPNCGEKIEFEKLKAKTINSQTIIIGCLVLSLIALLSVIIWLILPKSREVDLEELKEAVVQIHVYDENDEMIAMGSGVVGFENDIVITNAHVVEGNDRLEVLSENNTKYMVEGIIGYNKKKDIAILKLKDAKGLKMLQIEKAASIGDDVIAIGSPLGLKNTVSNGIFSGYYQDEIEVFQHTAPISSGSSGGALLDEEGNLIGITYASIEGGQNINLAIPIKEVEKEYNTVKNNKSLETRYYKYLNNGILKTSAGSRLIDYVLHDEYSNEKFKSGVQKNYGHLEYGSLKSYFEDTYEKIEDYIGTSLYIQSGMGNNYVMNADGTFRLKENGYLIVMMKLNDSSDDTIKQIRKYLEEYFGDGDYVIQNNEKYLYLLEDQKYENIDKVKNIMEDFIK